MKKTTFLKTLIFSLVLVLFSNSAAAQCTEPSSYNYQTISDGSWTSSSTWLGGSIPSKDFGDNENVLISHQVTYSGEDVKPKKGSILVINNGGSLSAKSVNLDNKDGASLIINNGTLTLTGDFTVKGATTFCGFLACVRVTGKITFDDNNGVSLTNSGLRATDEIILKDGTVTGSNIKLYTTDDLTNDGGTWAGSTVSARYVAGSISGFSGLPSQSSNTLEVCTPTNDLKVLKSVNNPTGPVGSTVIFTVTASNLLGASEPAAKVQDALPAGLVYVSHIVSTGTYNSGTGLWTIGTLAAGQSQTLKITAVFNSAATNSATISGDILDYNLSNNSASAAVAVGSCVNPSISSQPLVAQTVGQNGVVTDLAVTAAGTGPLTYQWYSNTTNSNTGGTLISGATSSTHTPSTSVIGTQYYYVRVTAFCGTPATSTVSRVIVKKSYIVTGCNDNTFLNAGDPNTIEYDNIVGLYHSTMMKKTNQELYVFGENSNPNGTSSSLTPKQVSVANGYIFSGSILKYTGTEYGQFALLTTTGLYIWGDTNVLISSGIKSSAAFGAVTIGGQANGLPPGVLPSEVKMLFGSLNTLAITTGIGDAWILSKSGAKNGDGTTESTANDQIWHRIKTGSGATDYLTNVVAMRGNPNAMMALTATGEVYTWGSNTYLGNNTAIANLTYATQMTLPAGVTPKMIGMTSSGSAGYTVSGNVNSYYILGSLGKLYSLGNNSVRQLGDFSTTERRSWVQVHKPNAVIGGSTDSGTFMENIAWFSPQEHDYRYGAVNAISSNGKLYSWGANSSDMLGTTTNPLNPTYMAGGLAAADNLLAVETGGHTTITFRQCSLRFGYVGHKINGSMGDGTTTDASVPIYNFDNTPIFNLCGAPTAPTVQDVKVCPGTTANLANALIGLPFAGTTVEWWTTPDRTPGTQVANPATAGPGTYYAFYVGICPNAIQSDPVVVSFDPVPPVATVTTQPDCTTPTGTVTVSAPTPAANVTYTITGINPIIAAFTQSSNVFAGLNPGTYTVTTTNTTTGCTSEVTNLTVNAFAGAPLAPEVGTITQPTCTTPTGSVVLSGLPSGNWTITGTPSGSVTGNTSSITITGLAPNTTYTYTVTNSTPCTSPSSVNVVINAIPDNPVLGGPSKVCVGSTINVTPNTGGTWSSNNSNVTVTDLGVVTGVTAGVSTLTFTDTTTGCTNTKVITVNSLPTITVSSVAACSPDLTTYTVSVTVSAGTVTSTPAVGTITNSGNIWTIVGVPAGTDILLKIEDGNTCSATVPVTAPICHPDYRPTSFTNITNILGNSGIIDFRVLVGEYLNTNSDGITNVELRIFKNAALNISFNTALTTFNGSAVNNPDWVFDGSDPSLYKFTYVGNGGIFQGNTGEFIGINATYNPSLGTTGFFPLKVIVKYLSGGEINTINNDDLDYIQYKNN